MRVPNLRYSLGFRGVGGGDEMLDLASGGRRRVLRGDLFPKCVPNAHGVSDNSGHTFANEPERARGKPFRHFANDRVKF